jgi:hypothetical protein
MTDGKPPTGGDNVVRFDGNPRPRGNNSPRATNTADREQPDWDDLRCRFEAGWSFQQPADHLEGGPEGARRTKECIRQRAKRDSWARDTTDRFRLEAREKLALEHQKRRREGREGGGGADAGNRSDGRDNGPKLAGFRADSAASPASPADGRRGRRRRADAALIADFMAIGRRQMRRAEDLQPEYVRPSGG